ncbi:biotin--[acetyl-CoA-carboxylase] ligase [Sporomusa acidovorans]|uniref:Bifunctional ligase/repressor BirA n=1 Tax=Sporomusa acidovorans (strain ATCC 49682 / DSM 3132 / Mol) TaxID=1123286 RepID=A0ABZ3IWF3_SPOA4|nr:biotin--[acetyl-CoA-carboxylase] ligase [Sporomusa acidovorans]OZC23698.1 bifunctional ligase/repressor BirA [Sporomusa acidovorans DSM 3132]SDE25548.1 BirA family transcriptional regulator, biotin operon repressor / biotin-[acetyl-CoA-carboxylase] ligase [Sporomusa acidovorans]
MRTAILELLKHNEGHYISGEELSHTLNVSRTAVWKHIRALKQDGYEIEAHPRLGYALRQNTDRLLPDEIKAHLTSRMLGQEIHYFPEVDSTNNEAKKLAANGCPEGTIVVAESQATGRGRLARGWFSPFGKGIWFSVVLRPPFGPMDAAKCTLMAAVGVNRAINRVTGVGCGIKWPNDILWNGRKVVGILTEMSAEMDAINYVVIGMGINANMKEFPSEIAATATSLALATGQTVSRVILLAEILAELENVYTLVQQAGFESVFAAWRQESITLGRQVRVQGFQRNFSGLAVDIDADGALLIKTAQGVERVLAGDVSIRYDNQ